MIRNTMIKRCLISSMSLLIFFIAPAYSFDFGKALSNAVDRSANSIVNGTANKVTNKINQAISSSIPKLEPGAKKDDGQRVDINQGVVIFGYDGCPHCRKAYSFLNKNAVNYQLMDTQKDAKASRIARENGIRGVPVIYVEGEKMVGYSEPKYRQLLRKHGKI